MRPWSQMDGYERSLAALEIYEGGARDLRAALHAVLERHHPARDVQSEERRCSECSTPFPCKTVEDVAVAMGVQP